jgi:hypothetical protein
VNKLTFYEQVGIVIPGSVFLFGLLLFFPVLQAVLTKDGVSVGELGIFVLLSYAAGHLIAAVGNAAESFLWGLVGGMPSGWVTKTQTSLLSGPQIDLLEKKVQSRLGITAGKIRGLDPKIWWPISRQIYADVAKNGKAERIDTFNGKLWPKPRPCRSLVCSGVHRGITNEVVYRAWTSCTNSSL